jgi:hypothetical protein
LRITYKSLLWMLVVLVLIGCQRVRGLAADPPPTPTRVAPSPTAAKVPPTPLPLTNGKSAPTLPSVAADVPRVTPDELKALLSSPRNILVVDTRDRDSYEAAHIRGAINIPYDQVEFAAPQLSRRAKIVFYCS